VGSASALGDLGGCCGKLFWRLAAFAGCIHLVLAKKAVPACARPSAHHHRWRRCRLLQAEAQHADAEQREREALVAAMVAGAFAKAEQQAAQGRAMEELQRAVAAHELELAQWRAEVAKEKQVRGPAICCGSFRAGPGPTPLPDGLSLWFSQDLCFLGQPAHPSKYGGVWRRQHRNFFGINRHCPNLTQASEAKRQALRAEEAAHSKLLQEREGANSYCCQVSGWCGLPASAGCRPRAVAPCAACCHFTHGPALPRNLPAACADTPCHARPP
jgi:hypothetical protein